MQIVIICFDFITGAYVISKVIMQVKKSEYRFFISGILMSWQSELQLEVLQMTRFLLNECMWYIEDSLQYQREKI
jgi:hypothetical protein